MKVALGMRFGELVSGPAAAGGVGRRRGHSSAAREPRPTPAVLATRLLAGRRLYSRRLFITAALNPTQRCRPAWRFLPRSQAGLFVPPTAGFGQRRHLPGNRFARRPGVFFSSGLKIAHDGSHQDSNLSKAAVCVSLHGRHHEGRCFHAYVEAVQERGKNVH